MYLCPFPFLGSALTVGLGISFRIDLKISTMLVLKSLSLLSFMLRYRGQEIEADGLFVYYGAFSRNPWDGRKD